MRVDAAALQREEEKATQVIKQATRNGQTRACRDIAAAIAASRKMSRRLDTLKFRLDSAEINLQQQRCAPSASRFAYLFIITSNTERKKNLFATNNNCIKQKTYNTEVSS